MCVDELLISFMPQNFRHEEWLKRLSFLLSDSIYVFVSTVKFCYCLCLLVRHKRESDWCQNVDADLMPHISISEQYVQNMWSPHRVFSICCFYKIAYSAHQSKGLIRCKSSGPSHLQQYMLITYMFYIHLCQTFMPNITIIQPLWIIYDRLAIIISRPWDIIVYKGFKFVISHKTSLSTYPFMPLVS